MHWDPYCSAAERAGKLTLGNVPAAALRLPSDNPHIIDISTPCWYINCTTVACRCNQPRSPQRHGVTRRGDRTVCWRLCLSVTTVMPYCWEAVARLDKNRISPTSPAMHAQFGRQHDGTWGTGTGANGACCFDLPAARQVVSLGASMPRRSAYLGPNT
jgi:hypothetical protein